MNIEQYLKLTGEKDASFREKIGLSQSQMSRVRRGVSRPSWAAIAKIEKVTGGAVTASDFIRADEKAEA